MEISKLLPILTENNVRLFAVGLEDFGHEEFVEGNYFKGDLYIDIDEASYKEIGYKKYGTIGVLMSLFHKTARNAISKVFFVTFPFWPLKSPEIHSRNAF